MKVGDEVGWKWGNGIAMGKVESIHAERQQIESNGALITRNGTATDPAIVIRSDKGALILKLQHEVKVIKREEHNV